MNDVKWIKIVTDIFDDEKILLIETLPEADSIIVIWFKLLCLAGKQNNSGVFLMNGAIPYTDKMFATIFRRKDSTVQLALKTFEEFGMIEIVNNAVTIPNWGKHQNIEQIEARKDYMRNYMKDYREAQKLIAEGELDGKSLRKCLHKQDVNPLDKIRIDKNREDEIREDEKEIREEKDKKNIREELCFDGVPVEILDEVKAFAKHRKKLKSPMTQEALDLTIKKLQRLSDDTEEQKAIINESIERGWKGVFALDDKKKTNADHKSFSELAEEMEGYDEH